MADLSTSNVSAGNTINAADVLQILNCLTGTEYDNFKPNGIQIWAGSINWNGSTLSLTEYFNNTEKTFSGSQPQANAYAITSNEAISGNKLCFVSFTSSGGRQLVPYSYTTTTVVLAQYDADGNGADTNFTNVRVLIIWFPS